MSMSPEPMSLGSPTQSPTHSSSNPTPAAPYHHLPQFLLGDMNSSLNSPLYHHHYRHPTPQQQQQQQFFAGGGSGSASSQRYWTSSNSPPRTAGIGTSMSGGPALHQQHFIPPQQHLPHHPSSLTRTYSINTYDYGHMRVMGDKNENSANMSGYGAVNSYSPSSTIHQQQQPQSTSMNQAPGAPPLSRLADIMNTKPSITPTHHHHHQESASILSPYTPPNPPDLLETSQQQQSSTSPVDDTWVTIFGHPPSATSYVLQEFANYGQIVRYIPPGQTEQGNWLHVKYQTRMQAQKALGKNGKVLGGQFMVGVMPCVDRRVMTNGVNNEENTEPKSNMSLRPSLSRLDRTQSLRATARPLTQLNRINAIAQDDTSIEQNAIKLPKKNTNLISKAMDFMFGW